MMRILTTATAIFIMTMFGPVSYVVAQDHGAPDTLYLLPSELEAGGNDSSFTLEAWIFNDADSVRVFFGFEWESELITLDSAMLSPLAWSVYVQAFLYDGSIDNSNLNNRAGFQGYNIFWTAFPPGPDPKLLATYYFTVENWTKNSQIIIDSLAWDDGTEMSFLTQPGEIYEPVWYGGDQPLIVRDVSEACCGMYTGGFTGNINCDPDGRRNLRDVIWLVARVYLGKTELCCEANGNVNGDVDGKIDLADIISLIDHIYLSKTETTACQ